LAYRCGVFYFTPGATPSLLHQSLHQLGELYKIRDSDQGTTVADCDLRIGPHFVRPLRRHRADGLLVDLQKQPRAVPVVPLADAEKLTSAERVERMRHAHKTRRRDRRACILS
jgi:hypothetical protein